MANKDYDNIHVDLNKYELVEALEDHKGDTIVKCRIAFLMPNIPSGKPKDTTVSKVDSHILNESKPPIANINASNYLNIFVPKEHIYNRNSYKGEFGKKNDIYICIFLGGDLSKPMVIGRYEKGNVIVHRK